MFTVLIIAIAVVLAALPLAAIASRRAAALASRIATPTRRFVQTCFALSASAALLLLLVQLAVVILVSIFSVSAIWLQESTAYLFAAMFLLGAGGVFLADGHVRVDVVSTRLTARHRAMIDLGGITLFVLPVCALIVIVAAPWAAHSWAELERSGEPSGLHLVYLLKSMIPAFAVILASAAFVRAEDAARLVRRS